MLINSPCLQNSKQMAIPNANLRYFVLNPLFARRAPFIFREVLRLFRKTVLYYRVYPNEASNNAQENSC